ncbi:MAG TPA: ABC transporter permease, partial [Streptosporangiaceae bacterium]
MTNTQVRPRPVPAPAPLPSLLTASLSRGRLEVTTFFREREAVVFIFALPAVLLLLLGSIFGTQHV